MPRGRTYWRNLIGFTLIVLVMVGCLGGVFLCYLQANALTHPARHPVSRTPDAVGFATWEEISFVSEDGLTLRGWFIPPAPQADGATIIYVHGLADNRARFLPLAARLSEGGGYGALLFDLRNHGESDGALTTLGYLEALDVQAAIDYALSREEVAQVGLIGHSLGSAAVIRAGAASPEARFVVAMSSFTSVEDNVAHGVTALTGLPSFPFGPLIVWFGEQQVGVSIAALRPVDDIAQIAPRPVMLVHGDDDRLIPARNSEQLYAAAGEPRTILIIPGGGHGAYLADPAPDFITRLAAFIADAFVA